MNEKECAKIEEYLSVNAHGEKEKNAVVWII
jgi:hypothetical protein